MIKNEIYYDDSYLGEGYFIVTKKDDKVIKFLKFSSTSKTGFPYFNIRGYEVGAKDNSNESFRKINFDFDDSDTIYSEISALASNLNGNRLYSINNIEHGKNNLRLTKDEDKVILTLAKDIYGVKSATDYIDITLGDNYCSRYYPDLLEFYRSLDCLDIETIDDNGIKRLIYK